MVDVTAVLCTSGQRPTLEQALRSLANQEVVSGITFEIVVVDNSAEDQGFVREITAIVAETSRVPVRYVREETVGLGFARNAGITAAEGEIVAFADDDALMDPQWISALMRSYRETGASAVGGRIEPIWETERPGWLGDELLAYLGVLDYGPDLRVCHYPHYPFGANISFRRADVLEVGGFATFLGANGAPTYLMDEIELCLRLEKVGKKILYTPEAKVKHLMLASRLKRSFFLRRAALLGPATARMWWSSAGRRVSPAGFVKGMLRAEGRVCRHAISALILLGTGQEPAFLSEARHLIWNLTWMREAGSLAVKGS